MEVEQILEIYELSKDTDLDFEELLRNFDNDETDFEVDNYRFIKESECVDILTDIYSGDHYILGCFNAEFIADNTSISYNAVKALQKAEAFEELGELIAEEEGSIAAMMEEYVRLDGHGHAFGSYDGSNEEVEIGGETYIYFRTA